MKGTLGRLVGVFEVMFAPSSSIFTLHVSEGEIYYFFFFVVPFQNEERKHRTYVYVLIVTEVLEDWEDSVNIGKLLVIHEWLLKYSVVLLLHSKRKWCALFSLFFLIGDNWWKPVLLTGRKREWFKIEEAIQVLRRHKPVQATYLEALQESCLTSNGTPLDTIGDLSPTYSINQSSVSGIR